MRLRLLRLTNSVTRTAPRALLLGAAVLVGCMNEDDKTTPTPPPPITSTQPEPPRGGPRTAFPGDTWRPRVRSECSERLPVPLEQGSAGAYLYFSCLPKRGPAIPAAATRELVGRDAAPKPALRLLLRGPTSTERRAGFFSPFGARTANLPFSLAIDAKGLAVVDLHRSIMDVPRAFISVTEAAQITSTVGQFPQVKQVEIRVGGEPLCRVLGEC